MYIIHFAILSSIFISLRSVWREALSAAHVTCLYMQDIIHLMYMCGFYVCMWFLYMYVCYFYVCSCVISMYVHVWFLCTYEYLDASIFLKHIYNIYTEKKSRQHSLCAETISKLLGSDTCERKKFILHRQIIIRHVHCTCFTILHVAN